MKRASGWFCALAWALSVSLSPAQDATPTETKVETVVSGLTDPAGIALQPETGAVFVADSGAGRICRIVDGKLEAVIQGSPTEPSTSGGRAVGPLGLAFVDKQTLAVGDGGYKGDEDVVRIFKLPAEGDATLGYEQAETKLKPADGKKPQTPTGDWASLALARHGLYVVSPAGGGAVWKGALKGTKFSDLEPVIDVAGKTSGAEATALALSPRGEVVLGLRGGDGDSSAAKLAFFSAKTHESLLKLDCGLAAIAALAYSPKTGLLYALGNAADSPDKVDLFRLDSDTTSGEQRIKAVKIAPLDQAAAMVFDKDGVAYITVRGKADASSDAPSGAVVKIAGL